ncbi:MULTISPECIES: hypothetical protein [unclassified Azospirillum]|uniref:hypothetical protein n=1 Tax=unclassified Azospirillum TaxID=2630922 RepID=UPI000B73D28E|nr:MULTISPECIES: hypothetical protein [unclassified Azospirillum]SNS52492.1 hypothetical protein SAMN05880556_106128 [Azospirillum sp. RU38E]SNS68974.1 hypothetical protein SAMN05880591_1068 [Azospirillum sp. RU37A]
MDILAAAQTLACLKEFHGYGDGAGSPGQAVNLVDSCVVLDLAVAVDRERLRQYGLSAEHVACNASDDVAQEQRHRMLAFGDNNDGMELDDRPGAEPILRSSHAKRLPYIRTVARFGRFLAVCPETGALVSSKGSFLLDTHHIAHRFVGRHVFYLLVGRWHGRRAALCIPSLNLLVFLDAPEREERIGLWMVQLMQALIQRSLAYPDAFRRRLAAPLGHCSLVLGSMPNMGHYFWQEMSGIDRLLSAGYLGSVDALLVGPNTWLQPQDVFPELASLPVTRCAAVQDMPVASLDLPSTLLRPVGLRISAGLRARLRTVALRSITATRAAVIAEAGARHRLVWINLRSHNKAWRSQVDGYAAILNTLHEEFGDIGVVFDGWTDSADVRDQISELLAPGIARHDTIGCSFEESLVWAEAVSTYISVVGSGLVINSWLVGKAGVAHANRAHLAQGRFWNSVSEGMEPVSFIDANAVSAESALYDGYDFDWRLMLPRLREILSGIRPPC